MDEGLLEMCGGVVLLTPVLLLDSFLWRTHGVYLFIVWLHGVVFAS
jgi:hypothetical protein